jgi:hypothetical protein
MQAVEVDHMALEGLIGRDHIGELRWMRSAIGTDRRGLAGAPDEPNHYYKGENESRNQHRVFLSEEADRAQT